MRRSAIVIDCASMFSAAEFISEHEDGARINFDYGVLRKELVDLQRQRGWASSKTTTNIAMVSVDPTSDAQGRFVSALERHGYEIDRVNYRDAFVSMPPGRTPPSAGERTAGERGRSNVSMASRIAYLAGLLARSSDSQLLVVSHAYELYWPLHDLAGRLTAGNVGLAYFSSLIDPRYRRTGLLESQQKTDRLEFFDLEPLLPSLTGGAPAITTDRLTGGEVFSKF